MKRIPILQDIHIFFAIGQAISYKENPIEK
jgi:hypothetical protein